MTTVPPPGRAGPLERLFIEQTRVLEAFDAARAAGVSTDAGVQRLRAVRQLLCDHLAVVDRTIYPLLRQLAADDSSLRRALTMTGDSSVSAQVNEFFARHTDSGSLGFFDDWGSLYVAVQRRFRLERTVLFPALLKSDLASELTSVHAEHLQTGRVPRRPNPIHRAGD